MPKNLLLLDIPLLYRYINVNLSISYYFLSGEIYLCFGISDDFSSVYDEF